MHNHDRADSGCDGKHDGEQAENQCFIDYAGRFAGWRLFVGPTSRFGWRAHDAGLQR
jgi:hypothetical protein